VRGTGRTLGTTASPHSSRRLKAGAARADDPGMEPRRAPARPVPPGRPTGRASDRGSAMVETALVAPLFLLLLFGVLEVGYAWLGRTTVTNMSVSGARAASAQADDVLADHAVLRAVQGGATSLGSARITMVVVYRATGPDDRVPAACRSASVTDSATTRGCNRYVAADLLRPSTDLGCVAPPARRRNPTGTGARPPGRRRCRAPRGHRTTWGSTSRPPTTSWSASAGRRSPSPRTP
jgi:Flp pilus assembly protein TadG